jgi:hypothetical protein
MITSDNHVAAALPLRPLDLRPEPPHLRFVLDSLCTQQSFIIFTLVGCQENILHFLTYLIKHMFHGEGSMLASKRLDQAYSIIFNWASKTE